MSRLAYNAIQAIRHESNVKGKNWDQVISEINYTPIATRSFLTAYSIPEFTADLLAPIFSIPLAVIAVFVGVVLGLVATLRTLMACIKAAYDHDNEERDRAAFHAFIVVPLITTVGATACLLAGIANVPISSVSLIMSTVATIGTRLGFFGGPDPGQGDGNQAEFEHNFVV